MGCQEPWRRSWVSGARAGASAEPTGPAVTKKPKEQEAGEGSRSSRGGQTIPPELHLSLASLLHRFQAPSEHGHRHIVEPGGGLERGR